MAKTVIYKGPTINLGRFEQVKDGQMIAMTDKEYEGVVGDNRFADASPEAVEAAKKKELETLAKKNAEQAKIDAAARESFAKKQAEENGTEPVAPTKSKK